MPVLKAPKLENVLEPETPLRPDWAANPYFDHAVATGELATFDLVQSARPGSTFSAIAARRASSSRVPIEKCDVVPSVRLGPTVNAIAARPRPPPGRPQTSGAVLKVEDLAEGAQSGSKKSILKMEDAIAARPRQPPGRPNTSGAVKVEDLAEDAQSGSQLQIVKYDSLLIHGKVVNGGNFRPAGKLRRALWEQGGNEGKENGDWSSNESSFCSSPRPSEMGSDSD